MNSLICPWSSWVCMLYLCSIFMNFRPVWHCKSLLFHPIDLTLSKRWLLIFSLFPDLIFFLGGASCNTPVIACGFFLEDVHERKNHLALIASSYHCSQVGHLSAWPPESDDEVGRDLLPFTSEKAILTIASAAPNECTLMRAITSG